MPSRRCRDELFAGMGLGKKGAAHGVGTVGMCEGIAEGAVGVPWSCFVGAARNGVDLSSS